MAVLRTAPAHHPFGGGTPRSGATNGCRNGNGRPNRCWSGRPWDVPGALGVSVPGELAVGDPVRARRFQAHALDLVGLVVGEVALEPEPLRRVLVGALPRQNVRGSAVEEPPVVADDHRT